MVAGAVFLFLAAAFIFDVKLQKIPNVLNAASFLLALLYFGIRDGLGGIGLSLLGAGAGFLPLLLLYLAKGIGAGDVKLFGALGAWVGFLPVLQMMLYSFLFAGAIAALLLVVRGVKSLSWGAPPQSVTLANVSDNVEPEANCKSKKSGKGTGWLREGKTFPFMLAVAPAAFTIWLVPLLP